MPKLKFTSFYTFFPKQCFFWKSKRFFKNGKLFLAKKKNCGGPAAYAMDIGPKCLDPYCRIFCKWQMNIIDS